MVPEMVREADTGLLTLHPHALIMPDILARKSAIGEEIEIEILTEDQKLGSERQ